MKKLKYQYNCVMPDSKRELLFICEHLKEVSRKTAMKYLDLNDVKELENWFGYNLTQLKMKDDWAVRYFKSKRENGSPVYGIIWSSQEYIFY